MKTELVNYGPKVFVPITIKITIETQQELDHLGMLANARFVSDYIELPSYDFLEDLGANLDDGSVKLLNIFKQNAFFRSECEKI